MTALICLATCAGTAAYCACLPCGRLFAAPFALLAAAVLPVIALG